MKMYHFSVAILLLTLGWKAAAIPLGSFYPFGAGTGDSSLASNDDGSSGAITLSFTFPYFGSDNRMVYVRHTSYFSSMLYYIQ